MGYARLNFRIGRAKAPRHILVISIDFGMRLLIQQELRQSLKFPVQECTPEALLRNPELAVHALVVGPPGAVAQVGPALSKDHPRVAVKFPNVDRYFEMIRQFNKPSVMGVVSVSELLLQTAEGILSPAIGRRHTLQTYFLPAEGDLNLAAVDLVMCDSIARRRVQARNMAEYRVVSPEALNAVSEAMSS